MVTDTPQGTRKGTAPRAPSNAGRLKKIHIEKVEGGYVVTQHHHAGGKGGTTKPKRHVFADYDGARQHLEEITRR